MQEDDEGCFVSLHVFLSFCPKGDHNTHWREACTPWCPKKDFIQLNHKDIKVINLPLCGNETITQLRSQRKAGWTAGRREGRKRKVRGVINFFPYKKGPKPAVSSISHSLLTIKFYCTSVSLGWICLKTKNHTDIRSFIFRVWMTKLLKWDLKNIEGNLPQKWKWNENGEEFYLLHMQFISFFKAKRLLSGVIIGKGASPFYNGNLPTSYPFSKKIQTINKLKYKISITVLILTKNWTMPTLKYNIPL